MAALAVKIEDSWRSDHEVRKYGEWVTALLETSEDGFHKRRSRSAPAEGRRHHPHIHHILSQAPNKFKSQTLEISKRGNVQAVFPHERSGLSFKSPTKKDVDGCQPTMRETSGFDRKRKKRRHSSDSTLPMQSDDILSPQSLEEIAALPSVRISSAS